MEIVETNLDQNDNWEGHTSLKKKIGNGSIEICGRQLLFHLRRHICYQIFGCAMGSPVSAVLPELVTSHIKRRALNTFSPKPRWWKQYVDDVITCLKQADVVSFHNHLNSVNSNIQFTMEHPTTNDTKQNIAFLDCRISALPKEVIEVNVYRKITNSNKYLDFNSHNPV